MNLTLQQKIDNFTEFLIGEAHKIGCVFIEESGEGHERETDTMLLEDVGGWLAPIGTPDEDAKQSENYRFAEWKLTDSGDIVIEFNKY